MKGNMITSVERKILDLSREIRDLIVELPEQHAREKREMYDKLASVVDVVLARIGMRETSGEFVEWYKLHYPYGWPENPGERKL